MDQKIAQLEKNVSLLSGSITRVLDLIASGFQKTETNFESLQTEIDSIKKKVDLINKNVESLQGTTYDGFDTVGTKLENLTEEISKINEVTKYDELFKNLEGLN